MHRLTTGTLQQIVHTRNNHQLITMLFQMDETLVGIHHLLQVDVLIHNVNKLILGIVLFIHTHQFIQSHLTLYDQSSKNTTREITTIWNEVYF